MSVASTIESRDEFRSEYELTLERWLRRRFANLCTAFILIEAIIASMMLAALLSGGTILAESSGGRIGDAVAMIVVLVGLGFALYYFWRVRHTLSSRAQVLTAAGHLILILGGLELFRSAAARLFNPTLGLDALGQLLFLHVTACLFLAWTSRESIRPMVWLIGVWAILELFLGSPVSPLDSILFIVLSPLILVPGLAITSLRTHRLSRRFRSEMFRRGFLGLRREIAQASSIHETLFPTPFRDASFDFDFIYRPMRFLGGDFIHRSHAPGNRLRIIVLDVTGHGLAAAMTVTRLDGEIERILAETPDITPSALIAMLNRYCFLILAPHSIFATGLVAEVQSSTGILRFASAGHPPAFMRSPSGDLTALHSTSMMFGADDPASFSCAELVETLVPQSNLILYTDGVIESTGTDGTQLGVDRFEALLRREPAPAHWPDFLDDFVTSHSGTHPEDDVLIACIQYFGPTEEEK